MIEVIDRSIISQTKIFLSLMCENVLKLNEIEEKKKQIKQLGTELYFRNVIDIDQLRMALYKLTAYKMKKFGESRFENIEYDQKKALQEARKTTKGLMETVIHKTLVDYSKYVTIAKKAAIQLQSAFRGRLLRLIFKMELMNHRINLENERAAERSRCKSIKNK